MLETFVKKMVARNGEREVIDSSTEEMQDFIINRIRPEFEDEHVLCIKFLVSIDEASENADETSWFINPMYSQDIPELNRIDSYDELSLDILSLGYSSTESRDSKMASEFLPELLLLIPEYANISILEKYSEFRNKLLLASIEDISDDKKYELFIHWLKKEI